MPKNGNGEYEAVLTRIREARNFDFRNYKRATLTRRIAHRLSEKGCAGVAEYLELIDREPAEVDALIASMLIKVTSFFRDPEVWHELSTKILPELLASRHANNELRIWIAGCSTGEEAYSIAMLVAEAMGNAFASSEVRIFATDVDEAAIAHARRGIYTEQAVETVPKSYRSRYFTRTPQGFSVRQDVRRVVVFGVNNLVNDAPISRLDLILCRNVFIYLDNTLQKRVLARFHHALRRGGALVLGRAELIPFAGTIFDPLDLPRRIYRKDHRNEVPAAAQERLLGLLEQENIARAIDNGRDELSVLGQYYRDVLDSSPLPVIATAMDGSLTLWTSAAARLWNRTESDVLGKKLTALGLSGLSGDLLIEKTAQVREGIVERETAEGILHLPGRPTPTTISVEVSALRDARKEKVGLLYGVQDVSALRALELDLRRVNEESRSANEKLQQSNEELRAANEELETTNEELQSANEELQTTNEELQSTNEELETTNEELQSTNAELDATNRELAHRTDEMHLLSLYQRTIVRSLAAAVIVTDIQGRITGWNLAAERLLGLPEGEALGQSLWTLRIPALRRSLIVRIRRALSENRALRIESVPYETPHGGKGYASLVAVSLMEGEAPLGSVVIFEDTTRLVTLQTENASLKQTRGRARAGAAVKDGRARRRPAARRRD